MLWDPDGPARKPPREVADLLLSTESRYGLAETFQQSLDPDFLLLTLGGTSRDAIERAYDWLIPVISKYPGTISRLPSTASCVLLLRAYGTEGDERTQLKELSSPLLSHIAGCLKGDYGEVDSVKAFDLLMSDVASRTGERRRCGRRVLADAMLQLDSTSEKSWTVKILEVKYATQLVPDAIKHMVRQGSQVCPFVRSLLTFQSSVNSFVSGKGSGFTIADHGLRRAHSVRRMQIYRIRGQVSGVDC